MAELPPEIEEGNIEYKRCLNDQDIDRLNKLKSQMLWRIEEGRLKNGIPEAIYFIGIENDGNISGISSDQLTKSISILQKIVITCEAEITSTQIFKRENGLFTKIIVRKQNEVNKKELRVAFIGPSGAGKSTMISVLTFGHLDNGNGSARSNLLRYNHEIKNGVTSSIKQEIMGFANNQSINYNDDYIALWENIVQKSDKIINFIDLPGSLKFIKTTIYALIAMQPEFLFITLPMDSLLSPDLLTNSELLLHIELSIKFYLKFNIHFMIIVTKLDKNPQISNNNKDHKDINDRIYKEIKRLFNQFKLKSEPVLVNKDDLYSFQDGFISVLPISNVTNQNIMEFKNYLNLIPINKDLTSIKMLDEVIFIINETFYISEVGLVITGILKSGIIKIGDNLLIGPYNNTFSKVIIKSIHKKQIPVNTLIENEAASFVIKYEKNIEIDKHMIIFSDNQLLHFVGEFLIRLDHETLKEVKLRAGMKLMIFSLNIYEMIEILEIIEQIDKIFLKVKFTRNKINYIRKDQRMLIRYNNQLVFGHLDIIR